MLAGCASGSISFSVPPFIASVFFLHFHHYFGFAARSAAADILPSAAATKDTDFAAQFAVHSVFCSRGARWRPEKGTSTSKETCVRKVACKT